LMTTPVDLEKFFNIFF